MTDNRLLNNDHILYKPDNTAGLCLLLNTYYNSHGRFYHNASHIIDCIESYRKLINQQRVHLPYGKELFIAILFHDIIYDIKAPPGENERKSADFCLDIGPRFWENHMDDVGSVAWNIVEDIIMATVHSGKDIKLLEARYMINIDLMSISSISHIMNKQNIRNEYIQAYTSKEYAMGRHQFLINFINRSKIYYSLNNKINDLIFNILEDQAKYNLKIELNDIETEIKTF